jgi:hypothetical protein
MTINLHFRSDTSYGKTSNQPFSSKTRFREYEIFSFLPFWNAITLIIQADGVCIKFMTLSVLQDKSGSRSGPLTIDRPPVL